MMAIVVTVRTHVRSNEAWGRRQHFDLKGSRRKEKDLEWVRVKKEVEWDERKEE